MNPGEKYAEYLKSEYWGAVSKEVKRKAGFRCQVCNSPHDLNAHHRTYENRGNEMQHLDDLVCLCRRCHETFHGKATEPIVADTIKTRKPKIPKNRVFVRNVTDEEILLQMPQANGTFVLTKELIDRCRINGAFTSATLCALGVTDKTSGWPARLVGKTISADNYKNALIGKNLYSRKGASKLLGQVIFN